MGYGIHLIFPLNRSTNPDCTGSFFYHFHLQQSISCIFVNMLFSVIGHIHKRRVEFHQFITHIKKLVDTLPFKRRKYLKSKLSSSRGLGYMFCYLHLFSVLSYSARLGFNHFLASSKAIPLRLL